MEITSRMRYDPRLQEKIWRGILHDMNALRDHFYLAEYVFDELHGNSDINVKTALKNISLNSGGLGRATNTTRVKCTVAINYLINGAFFKKNITDNLWILTGFNCPLSMYNKCMLCLDSSGDPQIVPGTAAAAAADVVIPAIPAAWSVVGYVQVLQSAGGAFTGGTTGLDDATTTDTYVNMAFHPDMLTTPVSPVPAYIAALGTTELV